MQDRRRSTVEPPSDLAVPLRVDALEPDRVQPCRIRGVPVRRREEADVAPRRDRHVSVQFHFHLIEIVDQVLLVGDAFQKRGFVVRHQRPAAVRPAIPMDETEVRWCDAIDERHVAANDRVFDLLLQCEHFGGWISCALPGEEGRRPRDDGQCSDREPLTPLDGKTSHVHRPRDR